MKFIEALKLRSKLFLLFILVTLGLVSVGIMGAINVNETKKNLDTLYFGSLVPVIELNEILQKYHSNIAGSLYKAQNAEMSPSHITLQLEEGLEAIRKLWISYESHYKRDEELAYTQYAALEIQVSNDYFKKIIRSHEDGGSYDKISLSKLEKKISHIHLILQKLIRYETDVAKYRRVEFLKEYNALVLKLNIVLSGVILVVLFTMFSVFRSIQNDQSKLEGATKKLKALNKKLESASYTDTLTDLHNRRYFNMVYERELKRAKRTHSYITFMMLDIDYFKQYNDNYGHLQGDNALKVVADVLRDVLKRPSDFLFRLGGEEFGVLLTQTDEKDSASLAQKICERVKAAQIEHAHSKASRFLTISIGLVTCIADDALDGDMLMSCADKMLYQAKEKGRDQYMITTTTCDLAEKA
ncbi:MAG: diguanylate cyclase [Helicobacteraceae bacterium]|nr:diguanylate cyclase [Helicobacteraceae bacterium]